MDVLMNKSKPTTPKISGCFVFFWGLFSVLVLLTARASAHELWVEPLEPHLQTGDRVQAHIIIGEMLVGDHQIYLPSRTEKLLALTPSGPLEMAPRSGSQPAIDFNPSQNGHMMLVYQSSVNYVNYTTFDKFQKFATKKGVADIADRHRERGLPTTKFKERYKRYAKASVFIGEPTTELNDKPVGMEVEFVMISAAQPDSNSQALRIRLFYQAQAEGDAVVTLFSRAPNGTVETATLKTLADGSVNIIARAGHDYLLDYVKLRELDPQSDRRGAVWDSLWASLTFSGPKE